YSGLGVARYLKEYGADFTVLEASKDVGGTWRFDPHNEHTQAVYGVLRLRVSRRNILVPLGDMHAQVPTCKPSPRHTASWITFKEGDGWSVTYMQSDSKKSRTESCDVVVVATGEYRAANWPSIVGQEMFEGMSIYIYISSLTVFECRQLTSVTNIKYLGVHIDCHLNWQTNTRALSGRTRKLIYIFKTLRNVCDNRLLISIYYALSQSVTTYCITSWGGCPKTTLITLERAQRALLKVMCFKRFRFPTAKLYKETSVLTVRQCFIKAVVLEQHKTPISDNMLNNRREDRVYLAPSCKTKFAQHFMHFLGPYLYNKLSNKIELKAKSKYSCKEAVTEILKTFSHDYREPAPFSDRRVLLVGAGSSGLDLAVQLSNVTARLLHSHHLQYNQPDLPDTYVKKPDILTFTPTGADRYFGNLSLEAGIPRVPPVFTTMRDFNARNRLEDFLNFRDYEWTVLDDYKYERKYAPATELGCPIDV
ncbi:Flavin-containing monooxygenase, partial [Operophtera brumata]